MALSLGSPHLPGTPDYVRQTGCLLLALLLPYYALAIGDGFFCRNWCATPAPSLPMIC